LPEPFDGGELHEEILDLEQVVDGMFRDIVPALEESDVDLARKILQDHKNVSGRVERGLQLLRSDQVLQGKSGKAVTAALYLRYLKRVSAHLKNVATSVLNPFHRIGFKEKKKGEETLVVGGTFGTEGRAAGAAVDEDTAAEDADDMELLEETEDRD